MEVLQELEFKPKDLNLIPSYYPKQKASFHDAVLLGPLGGMKQETLSFLFFQ